jgi:A/G-specific adenine glycosylase
MAKLTSSNRSAFERAVWEYYEENKRDLPWRKTRDPYAILVSEIMLQQTQVERVIPFYKNWLRKFPTFRALAKAPLRDVLAAWQGLGYNRRGIALHNLAKQVEKDYRGNLPRSRKALVALPGIGPYTAGAVLAFAYGSPEPVIETNIRRAYLHHFFPRKKKVSDQELLKLVAATMDASRPREWLYALMDYGAYLGKALRVKNPNRRGAGYKRQSAFKGSLRELRGKILRTLLKDIVQPLHVLPEALGDTPKRVAVALAALKEEGFISVTRGKVTLAA